MKFFLVYITTKDKEQAKSIGKDLVTERLAACVNILDGMTSMYRWQGSVVEDSETVLIAKTRESNVEKIIDRVKELHTYTCPCVVALPIEKGSEDYMKWLEGETE